MPSWYCQQILNTPQLPRTTAWRLLEGAGESMVTLPTHDSRRKLQVVQCATAQPRPFVWRTHGSKPSHWSPISAWRTDMYMPWSELRKQKPQEIYVFLGLQIQNQAGNSEGRKDVYGRTCHNVCPPECCSQVTNPSPYLQETPSALRQGEGICS